MLKHKSDNDFFQREISNIIFCFHDFAQWIFINIFVSLPNIKCSLFDVSKQNKNGEKIHCVLEEKKVQNACSFQGESKDSIGQVLEAIIQFSR